MDIVFIYLLIDPTSKQVRYVGKTTDTKRRIRRHINERFVRDTHKDRWIRKLLDNDVRPEIEIVDEVSNNDWEYWEKFYISYFKFLGCHLTNGTIGGDQPPSTKGRKHTDESKLKMSNAKKGKPIPWLNNNLERTDEHRKNLSKSLKGRVSINKGKQFSEELKKKMSNASTVKLKVKQLDLDDNIVKVWDSISEAQKALQIRHISEVCRGVGNNKTSGGYKWGYYEKKYK